MSEDCIDDLKTQIDYLDYTQIIWYSNYQDYDHTVKVDTAVVPKSRIQVL